MADADALPAVAVTVAVPFATARMTPKASGEAMFWFDEVHVAATRLEDPSEYCAVTESVSDEPTTSSTVARDRVMPVRAGAGAGAGVAAAPGAVGVGAVMLNAAARPFLPGLSLQAAHSITTRATGRMGRVI